MVLVLLAIPALSLLFIQNRQIQTLVSKYAADRLSEELHTTITLSSVNYSFFKRFQVRELYVEDLNGDTLLYSDLVRLRVRQLNPGKRMEIKKITLEHTHLNLVIDTTGTVNLTFITDRLKKPDVPPELKMRLNIASIELVDSRFSLSRSIPNTTKPGVNFSDLDISHVQATVEDLSSIMDTVHMQITSLSGNEKSGFDLESLTGHLSLGKQHLSFFDLDIFTPAGSELQLPELQLNFENYQTFKTFSEGVELSLVSENSLLTLDDLSYFTRLNRNLPDQIAIDGSLRGRLNNLRGDELQITFDHNSTLACDFILIGLPEIQNTFLDIHLREFNTTAMALQEMFNPVTDTAEQFTQPWINLGNLDFNGRFTGYPDNFVAAGLLDTDLGRMIMDLSFKPDSLRGVDFHGQLQTGNFKLGTFLAQEERVNQLDMNVYADGHLYQGEIEADLEGTIDTLELFQYAYSNIQLDGSFTNQTFDGGFRITDPNIRMDFLGTMDFSGAVPRYNFTADVARARPYYLKLVDRDPNSFASFLIETDLSGKSLDELNGEVRLVNSLFERNEAQLQLYDMSLITRNTPDTSLFQFRSEMFDASIGGKYRLSMLPASFRNLADQFLDVIPGTEPQPDTLNHFDYQVYFKRMNPLFDFFLPLFQIGEESQLHGHYDPSTQTFTSSGFFPSLQVQKNEWKSADLFWEIRDGGFQLHFQSDSMIYGDTYALEEHQFSILASNDTAHLEMAWDNRIRPRYRGRIGMDGTFFTDPEGNRGFRVNVLPATVMVNDDPWEVSDATLAFKKKYIFIDSLSLRSSDKHLVADGTISSSEGQAFNLDVRNLNLNGLSGLTGINAALSGNITGALQYKLMTGNPYITSDLLIDTLRFNDQVFGTTRLSAVYNDAQKMIQMKILSETDSLQTIDVDGVYAPASGMVDFDIHLNDFSLSVLDRYATSLVSDLTGKGRANLTLDGTLREPEFNGTIDLSDGEATLSYLNTRYVFDDRIRIYRNNFYLENVTVFDQSGNRARVNGTLSNNYLKEFYINLSIDAENLHCLQTTSADNDVFYGNVFASGNVAISGRPRNIKLGITATTERNTALYLPLYNASEVQTTDYITFIQESESKEAADQEADHSVKGLEMELEVEVTPDATVQLIFDPKVGDIIETSGRGNLRMILDPLDGFSIYGDVELMRGNYLFTLQNVINKRFLIEPGGRINFSGSPTNATIDLNAVYTTRCAPYNLYPGSSSEVPEELKNRIPVNCHLYLQGELQSPAISTGIELPTADPRTRDMLANRTSTEEELMKQFLSLLVINNFYSISGFGTQDVGTMNSSFAGVTASELLSNQLSNWLSQISDDFDIGVNYRPGDQISSDEVEVALSTQLLDDRIIISGNLDVGGQELNPSTEASGNPYIVGDFDVEFKVTDNISVIAFNRARDELLFETSGRYKQGVGLSFREEFDNLRQLWQRYREGLTNRKKRKRKSEEAEPED